MHAAWVFGLVAGVAASGFSAAGNLSRGDPHLVSVAPDLLSAVLVGALVYWAVRRAIAVGDRTRARRAGLTTTVVAAGVCGALMALFTLSYLPSRALSLAMFGGIASFVLVFAVGCCATIAGVRSGVPRQRTEAGSTAW